MKLNPNPDAIQVLQNNTLGLPVFKTGQGATAIAFSSSGRFLMTGGSDNIVRIRDMDNWQEVSQLAGLNHITSVAFTGDGKYAVAGDGTGKAVIFNPLTGEEIRQIQDVSGLTTSPTDHYIAVHDNNISTTVRILDAETGSEAARYQLPYDDYVTSFGFSPNTSYVASGTKYSNVIVWEALSGKEVMRIKLNAQVTTVSFSPDERYMAAGDSGGIAKVWEVESGEEVFAISLDTKVETLAFSPDGTRILTLGGTVKIWDVQTGQEIVALGYGAKVNTAGFSPDGRYVLTAGCDAVESGPACHPSTARVWEVQTGQEVARMTSAGEINAAVFSPNGNYVASGSREDILIVWKIKPSQETARVAHENGKLSSLAFNADGSLVLTTGCDLAGQDLPYCDQSSTRVWDRFTGQEIARVDSVSELKAAAFSSDGRYVISGGCEVKVWEALTGKGVASWDLSVCASTIIPSPDGENLISDSSRTSWYVWNMRTGDVPLFTQQTSAIAFSPTGDSVATGGVDGLLRILRIKYSVILWQSSLATQISAVAFSPDGTYLGAADSSGNVLIVETATGRETARLKYAPYVRHLAFSPDGRWMAASSITSIRILAAGTGKEVTRITEQEGIPYGLSFSPNSQYLLSLTGPNTVKVWDAQTGREVASLNDLVIITADFSPDSMAVLTGTRSGPMKKWSFLPELQIQDACKQVVHSLTPAEWRQFIGDALPYQAICPDAPISP